jgi:anti-sigma factor RsiW
MSKHLQDHGLLDAVEGEGTEDAREHLRSCGECASKVEGLRHTLEAVRDAGAPEPPPEYWDALRRQIARRVQEGEPRRSSWLWVPGLALAAGALGVALVLPAARRATIQTLPAWSAIRADEDTVMTALRGLEPSGEDLESVGGTTSVVEEVASLSDEEGVELSRALRAEMKGGAL